MNQHEDALKSVKQFKSIVEKMDELMKSINQVEIDIKNELVKISNLDKAATSIDKHLEDANSGMKESSLGMLKIVNKTKLGLDETKTLFDQHIKDIKTYQLELTEGIQKGIITSTETVDRSVKKLTEKIDVFVDVLEKIDQLIKDIKTYQNELTDSIQKGVQKLTDKINEYVSILDKLDQQNKLVEELQRSNQKNQHLILILVAISIIIGAIGLVI